MIKATKNLYTYILKYNGSIRQYKNKIYITRKFEHTNKFIISKHNIKQIIYDQPWRNL